MCDLVATRSAPGVSTHSRGSRLAIDLRAELGVWSSVADSIAWSADISGIAADVSACRPTVNGMATYDVPGVGTVIARIDEMEFGQVGYVLRSLDSAVRLDGTEVVGADYDRVESHLRSIGAIR